MLRWWDLLRGTVLVGGVRESAVATAAGEAGEVKFAERAALLMVFGTAFEACLRKRRALMLFVAKRSARAPAPYKALGHPGATKPARRSSP